MLVESYWWNHELVELFWWNYSGGITAFEARRPEPHPHVPLTQIWLRDMNFPTVVRYHGPLTPKVSLATRASAAPVGFPLGAACAVRFRWLRPAPGYVRRRSYSPEGLASRAIAIKKTQKRPLTPMLPRQHRGYRIMDRRSSLSKPAKHSCSPTLLAKPAAVAPVVAWCCCCGEKDVGSSGSSRSKR